MSWPGHFGLWAFWGAWRRLGQHYHRTARQTASGSVAAIHLTDVPFGHLLRKLDAPSPAEQKLFKKIRCSKIRLLQGKEHTR